MMEELELELASVCRLLSVSLLFIGPKQAEAELKGRSVREEYSN